MANLRSHDPRKTESVSCKCSKSDLKIKKSGAPYLENAVSKIEERRGDLANRQHYLQEKITAMERSIPALMAINMWKSGNNCEDAPMCKIKQIMSKVSSQPDSTERLLDSLKNAVKSLNTETAELHEKIIAADIKLEESDMELESLELANKEFEDRMKSLEKEVKKNNSPSLHSIHSEDLFCLTKIRQLGEEEVNLKHSIRELEERETLFQEQMNRILTSKEFRKAAIQNQAKGQKNCPCPMHIQTQNDQQTKNQAKEQKNCPCPMHVQTQNDQQMKSQAKEQKNCPCPMHVQTQNDQQMKNQAKEQKNCPCPIHVQTQSAQQMKKKPMKKEKKLKKEQITNDDETEPSKEPEPITNDDEMEPLKEPDPITNDDEMESLEQPDPITNDDEMEPLEQPDPITNDDENDSFKELDPVIPESSSSDDAEEENFESATTSPIIPAKRENGGAEKPSKSCSRSTPVKAACYDKFSCPSRTSPSGKLQSIACYDKFSCPSRTSPSGKSQSSQKNSSRSRAHVCGDKVKNKKSTKLRCSSPKSCRSNLTMKSNSSRGQGCSACCKNSSNHLKSSCKGTKNSLAFKSKCCKDKSSCWLSAIAKCPASTTCGKCHGLIPCRERPQLQETSRCRCSCRGKCAMGESTVPCNCADWLDSPDEEGYKPIAGSMKIGGQSSTDEEYSDCCDCGCNDSDFSDSCLF